MNDLYSYISSNTEISNQELDKIILEKFQRKLKCSRDDKIRKVLKWLSEENNNKEVFSVNVENINKVMEKANPKNWLVLYLLKQGMSVDEVLVLKVGDINFADVTIRNISIADNEVIERLGKYITSIDTTKGILFPGRKNDTLTKENLIINLRGQCKKAGVTLGTLEIPGLSIQPKGKPVPKTIEDIQAYVLGKIEKKAAK
jgi:thiol-disulfide isomerase/thioredoxin